ANMHGNSRHRVGRAPLSRGRTNSVRGGKLLLIGRTSGQDRSGKEGIPARRSADREHYQIEIRITLRRAHELVAGAEEKAKPFLELMMTAVQWWSRLHSGNRESRAL